MTPTEGGTGGSGALGRGRGATATSPFASTAPTLLVAVTYAVAAAVWVVAGGALPGGRWLAVHLFTLGVLTNVILALSDHFGRALTRTARSAPRWPMPVLNLGVLLVLVGLPTGGRWAIAIGGTIVSGVVVAADVRLRRMRLDALGARFTWVVRLYERAHGAFVHGAVLGLLLGVGALPGAWYLAGRTAHLHVNLLGWAGLTLLATLVFFGPTIVRTRIVDGADVRASTALRHGATGLTVAVLLLLATGVGGVAATVLRVLAAVAMSVYAAAVTITCAPVATAAAGARRSSTRWAVVAVASWFQVAAWVDVLVLATGAWRWLDALGLAAVLGVLVQAVAATIAYLAPMLRAFDADDRARRRALLDAGARTRAGLFNLGVVVVVAAAVVGGSAGHALAVAGWSAVLASLAWLLGAAAGPVVAWTRG